MKKRYKTIIFLLIIFMNLANTFNVNAEQYSSRYDPRELGLMTPVKDQGELGVC